MKQTKTVLNSITFNDNSTLDSRLKLTNKDHISIKHEITPRLKSAVFGSRNISNTRRQICSRIIPSIDSNEPLKPTRPFSSSLSAMKFKSVAYRKQVAELTNSTQPSKNPMI